MTYPQLIRLALIEWCGNPAYGLPPEVWLVSVSSRGYYPHRCFGRGQLGAFQTIGG